jgi:hypothetical protein
MANVDGCQFPIAHQFQLWAPGVSALIAAAAAFGAAVKYGESKKLERAKWVLQLYEKFYEEVRLRRVREILDCGTASNAGVDELVDSHEPDFIDYLNFFEFVSYLQKSGQVDHADVDALFGYYIRCLADQVRVRKYISDYDFQYLDEALIRRGSVVQSSRQVNS